MSNPAGRAARVTDQPTRTRLLNQRAVAHHQAGLSRDEIRAKLHDEGFEPNEIDSHAYSRPTPSKDESETHDEPPASEEEQKPQRASSSGGFSLSGTGGGLALALFVYPPALAYFQGGLPELKRWFRAKFLNDDGKSTPAPGPMGPPQALGPLQRFMSLGPLDAAPNGLTPTVYLQPNPNSGAVATVISFAASQIGQPYKWGGTGNGGWDCSGLTQAAYASIGVKLPRTSYQQLLAGRAVSASQLQPGDLVFPDPGHVQLYVGGGQVIEAPHTGAFVRESTLGGVMTARRIL